MDVARIRVCVRLSFCELDCLRFISKCVACIAQIVLSVIYSLLCTVARTCSYFPAKYYIKIWIILLYVIFVFRTVCCAFSQLGFIATKKIVFSFVFTLNGKIIRFHMCALDVASSYCERNVVTLKRIVLIAQIEEKRPKEKIVCIKIPAIACCRKNILSYFNE